jgi:hypothetical protein
MVLLEQEHLIDEMKRVVGRANGKGVILRGLGATAIRIHSESFAEKCPVVTRNLTDLDFITYGKQEKRVMEVFRECGYEQDRARAYIRTISGRSILENSSKQIVADLFVDRLSYNHRIELNGRLELDPLTIPLADLLLEKTQIVQINEKDVKDSILMLRQHPLGDGDDETVNIQRLCRVLSDDWGFYYTVTNNLARISQYAKELQGFGDDDQKDVLSKIEQLKAAIETSPKSLGWKMRARVGPKRKWYNDVEELVEGH